jgi:hypothetical protein
MKYLTETSGGGGLIEFDKAEMGQLDRLCKALGGGLYDDPTKSLNLFLALATFYETKAIQAQMTDMAARIETATVVTPTEPTAP